MNYQESFVQPESRFRELPQEIRSIERIQQKGGVVKATITLCDDKYNLYFKTYCGWMGIIESENVSLDDKPISKISRVGKPTCFIIENIDYNNKKIYCNRRIVQERAERELRIYATEGDILRGEVTSIEEYGVFVDIGCGIISLLPIQEMSASRISRPEILMKRRKEIFVIYKGMDEKDRFLIGHKELLGTWEENAEEFSIGQTVIGIVSGVEEYGSFVILTPNLAGLLEPYSEVKVNDVVSVCIKNIDPIKKKVKLSLIEVLDLSDLRRDGVWLRLRANELRYFIDLEKKD